MGSITRLPLVVLTFLVFFSCNCVQGGSPEKAFKKGLNLLDAGKTKEAFKAFKYAAKKEPDSLRYHFAAAQTAPDQNTAFLYTNYVWEKGLKTIPVFYALVKLSFQIDKEKKLAYTLNLFQELPDSLKSDRFRAQLFYQFDRPDSAAKFWLRAYETTKDGTICPKIAMALVRQGKTDSALTYLFHCRDVGVLEPSGYVQLISLLAMQFNFKEIEKLFTWLSTSTYYNDAIRIEYATYLMFHNRFEEALPLVQRSAGPASPAAKALIDLRCRTMLAYRALMEQKEDLYDSIINAPPRDTLFVEQEKAVFAGMAAASKKDTSAFVLLQTARKKLPKDPVTVVIAARLAVNKGLYKEAVSLYKQLPAIVLWSPRIVAEHAKALSLMGNDDEALQVVSFMHKKACFTRQSLELYRNLTYKKDLLEKSGAAQKLLEEHYSNDVGLKWQGLMIAIKNGKNDSALSIATQLVSTYPDDERFALTRLSLLLLKGDYQNVINESNKSKATPYKLYLLRAKAWLGLEDTTRAITAYEQALTQNEKDPAIRVALAELYLQKKAYKKATALYAALVKTTPDSSRSDSARIALLLNNYAWTLYSSGNSDTKNALAMAKKAHEILPENTNILDTYATILLQENKSKECIELLEQSSVVAKQKRLLCQLAKAFEKQGDRNKARRYLEDALKVENKNQLTELMSDTEIRKYIGRLIQKPE